MTDAADPPILTDHAVLRYAERVLGLPVRRVVEERVLSDADRVVRIKHIFRGRIRLGRSDIHLVIEQGRVATVIVNVPGSARPGTKPRLEHE